MLIDLFRRLALRGRWAQAAGVAVLLLALPLGKHLKQSARSVRELPVPAAQLGAVPSAGHRSVLKEPPAPHVRTPGFERYTDIYRVRMEGDTDDQSFVFSGPMGSDMEGMIGCVDAFGGEWRWRRPAAAQGRYTCLDVSETTLLEVTGYPEENTLAVRRLSDGAVLGRPWEVGRIWLTAISGRRVITVGEGPPGADSAAPEAIDDEHDSEIACVYDEWGHLLRSFWARDPKKVIGFRRGFALTCRDQTLILSDTGRVVRTLR